jgi:nitrite reductase/ring-hydroxylating ferredoxin subunit
MAVSKRLIANSQDLSDGGTGVRFLAIDAQGAESPAFVIRHRGKVHGFINRCAHIQVELDWQEGQFFDDEQRYLICATHGALYQPDTGECIAGPCKNGKLEKLAITEDGDGVFILE